MMDGNDMRMKMFFDEYRKFLAVFDDILSMRESMSRLEKYMIIMVCQVTVALAGGVIFIGASTNWNTDSNVVRLVGCRPLKHSHITKSTNLDHHLEEDEDYDNCSQPESCPSLVSGPSTFLHFPSTPPPSIFPTTSTNSSYSSSRSKKLHRKRSHSLNSSTISFSTTQFLPRSRSYSSIPTIDRTISEDSMLIIKKL
ncbi:unnamed protein product [Caenorhabditis angaria]|uniref:Uncharacterized protein n=1 Tax=Caenorhabditis angaria TaxID=860376 RepID=A0A9P1ICK4_9PELO|nr:unnamed protein product [Caenorhabditis angaria]